MSFFRYFMLVQAFGSRFILCSVIIAYCWHSLLHVVDVTITTLLIVNYSILAWLFFVDIFYIFVKWNKLQLLEIIHSQMYLTRSFKCCELWTFVKKKFYKLIHYLRNQKAIITKGWTMIEGIRLKKIQKAGISCITFLLYFAL